MYKPLKQVHIDIIFKSHHTSSTYFGFLAILNALSCNILSEAVLLVKSKKLD